ncbi:MAG: carboxypeptidase-like regulatory domain-containing protein [Armatimonadota bacterium]
MNLRSWLNVFAAAAGMVLLMASVGAAASLTVTVVDGASGTPVDRAVVAVVSGDSVLAAGRTNAQGVWSATVRGGSARITASRRLYTSATSAPVKLNEGATQVRLKLTKQQSSDYRRFGRVVGFVRNPQGQPVGNATLVLIKGNGPVGATQPENATGVYELEWYPPGTYAVLGTAPGHKTSKYSGQSISAGESLWLDVTLQPK